MGQCNPHTSTLALAHDCNTNLNLNPISSHVPLLKDVATDTKNGTLSDSAGVADAEFIWMVGHYSLHQCQSTKLTLTLTLTVSHTTTCNRWFSAHRLDTV